MNDDAHRPKKRPVKRIIAITFAAILLTGGFLLYQNFSKLIADALLKRFNSGIASDVYELGFEDLSVNPFTGTVEVYNVTMRPREKPLQPYPYINSYLKLTTKRLVLRDVELFTLLTYKQLKLTVISVTNPDVELTLSG